MRVARNTSCGLGLFLLFTYVGGCSALPAPAIQRIRTADREYRCCRYAAAEELLSPVIAAHQGKPETAEALYLRGLCRLRSQRVAEARSDLDKALHLARRNDLVDRIHAQLGNIAFDMEKHDQAIVHYEQGYNDLPNKPPKDRVGYQYGVVLQRVGRWVEGRSVLSGVAGRFPKSDFAGKAGRKAAWPHDHYAIQCGAYRNIAGAHKHADSLRDRGIDALAVPHSAASATLYLVCVGHYRTYAAARDALPTVRQAQSDAFIVP